MTNMLAIALLLLLAFFFTLTTARILSNESSPFYAATRYKFTFSEITRNSVKATSSSCGLIYEIKREYGVLICDDSYTCSRNRPISRSDPQNKCVVRLTDLCQDTKYSFVQQSEHYATFTTLPGDPELVQGVKVEVLSANEVKLSWTKPRCPRSVDLNYLVIVNNDKVVPGPNSHSYMKELTIRDLEASTLYQFQIKACLKPDNRRCSLTNTNRIATKPDKSGPVDELSIETVTSSSAILKWSLPNIPNGPVDFYRVVVNDALKEHQKAPGSVTEVFELKDLTPFTEYNVTVYAVNKVDGKELEGEKTSVTFTTKLSKPGPVEELTISDITDTGATVKWEEPKVKNGPIDFYEVLIDVKSWQTNRTEFQIPDLAPNTNYLVAISATNLDGDTKLTGDKKEFKFNTKADTPPDQPNAKRPIIINIKNLIVLGDLCKDNKGELMKYLLTLAREASNQSSNPEMLIEYDELKSDQSKPLQD